jgi:hypothetical protein
MNRAVKNTIIVLSLILFPQIGRAQLKDNFELNLFGGGSFYNSNRFEVGFPQITSSVIGSAQATAPVQGLLRFSKEVRGGVRVGVYTRGHWSEEFFYSYEPGIAHIVRRSPPTTSIDLGLNVHNYGVTALYYFAEDESRGVRPFVSIGVGGTLYHLTPEAVSFARDPFRGNLPGINNTNEVTLNYGIGLKTRTSNWLGFRADLRGFVGHVPSFGLPRQSNDPNAVVFPVTGAIDNGEASVGVVFYFYNKR